MSNPINVNIAKESSSSFNVSVSECCYWTEPTTRCTTREALAARASSVHTYAVNFKMSLSTLAAYEFCRRNDIRHSQFRSTSLVAGDGTCVQCMMALLPKLSCHRSLKTPILLPELLLTSLPKYTQGSPEFLGILITLILETNGHRVSTKESVCSFISREEDEHRNYLSNLRAPCNWNLSQFFVSLLTFAMASDNKR